MDPNTEQEKVVVLETPKPKSNFIREIVSYAIIAIVVVFPIRLWIAQPFIVSGGSMDTTFTDGEYLVVDEISYRFQDPARGDVLIFKYPGDTSKYFIKRLIGLPGETVIVKNDKVTLINAENPKGIVLNEPYIHSKSFLSRTLTLGKDEYFVMGDNRGVSLDSRAWGVLPKSDIIGRPFARLLPISKIDLFPGAVASSSIAQTVTASTSASIK